MKKTLLITLDFWPDKGGVAGYLANLCLNLPKDKIVVLAPAINGEEKIEFVEGLKIYRRRMLFNFWPRWLKIFFLVFKLILTEKIKVLLVAQILPIGTIALVFRCLFGIPFIVNAHGMDVLLAKKISRRKLLTKKIFLMATFITANSNFTKEQVLKFKINEKKIIVVYPCPVIIQNEIYTAELQDLVAKLALNKKMILSLCRLVERKGLDMVIKAFAEIKIDFPETIYVIVGNGSDQGRLLKIAGNYDLSTIVIDVESEIKSWEEIKNYNIIIFNKVKSRDVSLFYKNCLLYIQPSRRIGGDVEGFGIVYLEANYYKKPVIGGRGGGVEEAIQNFQTGILVDPENKDEIVIAMNNLILNDNLRHKMGEQGHKRVEEQFNWKAQAKLMEKILS